MGIKKVDIPDNTASKWVQVFQVKGVGVITFVGYVSTYTNKCPAIYAGTIGVNTGVVLSDCQKLAGIGTYSASDIFSPAVAISVESGVATVWARGNYNAPSYFEVRGTSGIITVIQTTGTLPDGATIY